MCHVLLMKMTEENKSQEFRLRKIDETKEIKQRNMHGLFLWKTKKAITVPRAFQKN